MSDQEDKPLSDIIQELMEDTEIELRHTDFKADMRGDRAQQCWLLVKSGIRHGNRTRAQHWAREHIMRLREAAIFQSSSERLVELKNRLKTARNRANENLPMQPDERMAILTGTLMRMPETCDALTEMRQVMVTHGLIDDRMVFEEAIWQADENVPQCEIDEIVHRAMPLDAEGPAFVSETTDWADKEDQPQ